MSDETTLNPAIHAAFRRDLQRFLHHLGAFRPEDTGRAAQLADAWGYFSYQLHRHHQDEETFFWPAFGELGVDHAVIDSLEAEHGSMVEALDAADAAMHEFALDPGAGHAATAHHAIADLNRVLLDHLAHEQRDLDPFSIRHKHSPQHKSAERAARKAHTEGAGNFFAWLCDDADSETTAIVRREVPAAVLWPLVRLGGGRYRRIAAAWNPR